MNNPKITYQISMPHPQNHLFEVLLRVTNWRSEKLDLKMPVWTPGSYLVREYSKQLQNFRAVDRHQKSLTTRKISKHQWQIDTTERAEITISYQMFANELTVRTNHLDLTHGYFNPAALCFYIPGCEQQSIELTIVPPHPDWQVITPLAEIKPYTFLAPDFDTLVDSPFEIGYHRVYDFTVLDKPHQLVVWGEGNLDPHQTIADISKIIAVEADIFGGLPYDRYLFLLHLSAQNSGGLEHKTSCSLIYPRFNFRDRQKYNRFSQLVAHEFFHLWNVKRIRPAALEQFDYDRENYTPSLWFSEGTTSYYDLLIPLRAGIYDRAEFFVELSKEITRYLTTPGRLVQPLSESSFDAWIKLYRPDANSPNAQISYYLKGEMVTLLLDLLIRDRSHSTRSFDDVMRRMWSEYGQDEMGFTEEQLKTIIEEIADTDLTDFYDRFIHGVEELPFNEYLAPLGLELQPISNSDLPHLGMTVKTEYGKALVKSVTSSSPAQIAGIDVGDELLALDGFKVSAEQLNERLKNYQPGEQIQVTCFHHDRLFTTTITLAQPQPDRFQLQPIEHLNTQQSQQLTHWLGV
jgi:predicted metalloprotease with PDZ domain